MKQEPVRRSAPPLRIGWREVLADIALADGPQDGVGQGVQTGVGVGVTDQGLVVVDPDPAKPDRIAGPPAVGVDAKAGPDDPPARLASSRSRSIS